MKTFRIKNIHSGAVLGHFRAESEADALDVMAREVTGYRTYSELNRDMPAAPGSIGVTEIGRQRAVAMNTIPTIPARMSVDALKRLAADNALDLQLTWRWAGRSRHGVLTVSKGGINLFSESFARSTRMWGSGDENLDLVHTGSPKHHAVLKALASLTGRFAKQAITLKKISDEHVPA